MIALEKILRLTQPQLFNFLSHIYRDSCIFFKGSFILVPGDAPIMLLAHLDTVHEEPVREICATADGNILMSPQGIGGDDRCGVYALIKAHHVATVKPWLLFTCDEEVGGIGAEEFCFAYESDSLPVALNRLKMLVEIDRKGSNDAVYYDCGNKDFEDYITSKGFKTAIGSFSDISVIAPELGIAAVNLSSGYYNAHTLHEYINRAQLETVIEKVIDIIADASFPDFPAYKYIAKPQQKSSLISSVHWTYRYYDEKTPDYDTEGLMDEPRPVPNKYLQIYDELLDLYSVDELEQLRNFYGDHVLLELYLENYPGLYPVDDEK